MNGGGRGPGQLPDSRDGQSRREQRIPYMIAAAVALGGISLLLAVSTVWLGSAFPWMPDGLAWGILALPLVCLAVAIAMLREAARAGTWVAGLAAVIACALALTGAGILFSWGRVVRTFGESRKAACMNRLKDLAAAASSWAVANGGALPDGGAWSDEVAHYVGDRQAFTCPVLSGARCAYAFNARLSRVNRSALIGPGRVVMIFESDRGRNATGGPELLPVKPRWIGGDNYAFADGHVAWFPRSKAGHLRWQPLLRERSAERRGR